MPLLKNQTIALSIDSISSDGNGVGRYEGQAVFVPFAAEGDRLQVKIVKSSKRYAYGRIHQVVAPGPGRVKEDCPISGRCGGCSFRHLHYDAELAAKHGFVYDALRRLGGLDVQPLPILPSPLENRYRNKVQYPVAPGPGGTPVYGFYAPRSHRVVPCANCLLQPELLNRIAARTAALLAERAVPAYNEADDTGLVRHIYLRQSQASGGVMLCLVATQGNFENRDFIVHTLCAEFPEIETALININPGRTNVVCGGNSIVLAGSGELHDVLCGVPLHLGPHSFSQVNTPAAERLLACVQDFAALQPHEHLLDLYCGAGVIGLSMAAQCAQLTGVDIVSEAVQAARRSAADMGLAHKARFVCADADTAAARFAAEGARPDVAVLDPPRKGCGEETLAALVRMAPHRVVMVSCNPATLARDLAFLVQNGYAVQRVQPVDLFPRTRHVESVALMMKV